MKQAFLLTSWLLCSVALSAQGEMSNLVIESNPFLCKPGVTNKSPGKGVDISYTYNPEFKMRPVDAENPTEVEANRRFMAKLKVPLINRPGMKFMLGFKYASERYSFDDIDPANYPLFSRLNEVTLKNSEAAAYLIMPLNHKFYTSFRFSTSFRGDYDSFLTLDTRYATYRAAGLFGVKKNEDLEYGVGVFYSHNIRRAIILPFGFLNWTFNDKWGLEAAIPVSIKMRRNLTPGSMMLFGVDYASQSYAVNVNDAMYQTSVMEPARPSLFHYRRASIELNTSYLMQMTGWTWMQFKLGYAINLNSDALDLPNGQTYDLRPTGSVVGTISFFLSPPKNYVK